MISLAHCCMCACQRHELESAELPRLRCCKQTFIQRMVEKHPIHVLPLTELVPGLVSDSCWASLYGTI